MFPPMPKRGCLWHCDEKGWCGKPTANIDGREKAYCEEHHRRATDHKKPGTMTSGDVHNPQKLKMLL